MKVVLASLSSDGKEEYFIADKEMPTPLEHEVVIQVKACGLSKVPSEVVVDLFGKSNHKSMPVGTEVSGIVTQVGANVARCKTGDIVAGLLPLDSQHSGCAEFCVTSEYNVVSVPDKVEPVLAAVGVGDGIRAFSSLHYQARLGVGDTVLIIGGASSSAASLIQLAAHWGAKVLTTCLTLQEKAYLEKLNPPPAHVIELSEKTAILVSSVLEETGGLGADIIIDNGVSLFSEDTDKKSSKEEPCLLPSKHELISCLAVGGRWLTSHPHLQLDPPDSRQLFLKGASVSFMFDQAWTLSSSQQGRLLHMLHDILNLIASGVVRPHITELTSLQQVPLILASLSPHSFGRSVMLAAS